MLKTFPNLIWYWRGNCCHCSPLISVVMFSPSSSLRSFSTLVKPGYFPLYLYIPYYSSLQLSLCHFLPALITLSVPFPTFSELGSSSLSHHHPALWDQKTGKERMSYKTVFNTSQHWYNKIVSFFIAFKLEELFELSYPEFCHQLILDTFVTGLCQTNKSNVKQFLLRASSKLFLQNLTGCDLQHHDWTSVSLVLSGKGKRVQTSWPQEVPSIEILLSSYTLTTTCPTP